MVLQFLKAFNAAEYRTQKQQGVSVLRNPVCTISRSVRRRFDMANSAFKYWPSSAASYQPILGWLSFRTGRVKEGDPTK